MRIRIIQMTDGVKCENSCECFASAQVMMSNVGSGGSDRYDYCLSLVISNEVSDCVDRNKGQANYLV